MNTDPHPTAEPLDKLFPVRPDELTALDARLAESADRHGVLDIGYLTITTPVGPMLLAASQIGLIRVAYEREDFDTVLQTLADRIGPRILQAPHRLSAAAGQLQEYFAGHRRQFDLPLDRRLSAGFRQAVQAVLPEIGYGRTATYKQVAELVGSPAAVRAVGTACATNPLPVVVPCHRVLRSDGAIGGYIGGVEVKSALLALERAA